LKKVGAESHFHREKPFRFIVDAHEDIADNAMQGRDFRLSALEKRTSKPRPTAMEALDSDTWNHQRHYAEYQSLLAPTRIDRKKGSFNRLIVTPLALPDECRNSPSPR